MQTIKLTKGQAQDLAGVLDAVPPKEIANLKDLSLLSKVQSKLSEAILDLLKAIEEVQVLLAPDNKKLKELEEGSEEHVALFETMNKKAKKPFEKINELREAEVEVELSNDQSTCLQENFQTMIMPHYVKISGAVAMGEILGIDELVDSEE